MDAKAKKKQLDRQRRDKIKRLFQNSVGVTASATAVVVATPLFDNVAAEFNEFKLLEDSIYYEIEVIEEVAEDGTANGRPLRLVIENQWERIEVDLAYGLNEQVLEDLRPNANYNFTVQMDKGVTWVTLANESVSTENELAGVIGPLSFEETPNAYQASLELYTQAGGVDINFYQLVVIEANQTLSQSPVSEGESATSIDFPKTNASFQLQLQAITADSELIVLDEKTIHPPAYFEASMTAQLINPTQVLIQPSPDLDAFTEQTYRLDIIENGILIDSLEMTDDTVIDVAPENVYEFVYYVTYVDDRLGTPNQKTFATVQIETPDDLFYVLNIIEHDASSEYLLSVENYDTWFKSTFVRGYDASGTLLFESPLSFVSEVGPTSLFRLVPSPNNAYHTITIGLILNQPNDPELVIHTIGE